MRFNSIIPLLLILSLAACQRDGETGSSESPELTDPASAAAPQTSAPPAELFQQLPASPDPATVPSSPATQPVQTATKQEALNPPHGQPGHRCDIPVGAPLSSAPKVQKPAAPASEPPVDKTTLIYSTPSNTPNVVVPDPASAEIKPGMNPPHGQPGHRCDIPVGAPLPTDQN